MTMGPLSQRTDEAVAEKRNEASPRADRSARRWTTIAAVVGILACLGIGAALIAGHGSSSGSDTTGVGAPAHGALGALGPVSQTRVRALLGDRAAKAQVEKAQDALRRAGASAATGAAARIAMSTAQANAAVQRCAASLGAQQAVAFTGYGTYRARPVAVVAVRNHGRTVAFVTSLENCQQILLSVSH